MSLNVFCLNPFNLKCFLFKHLNTSQFTGHAEAKSLENITYACRKHLSTISRRKKTKTVGTKVSGLSSIFV
jgi:hypothetical protein